MRNQWFSTLKVVGVYLIVGALWILFSDKALELSFEDPRMITRLQTYKGWFYVLITAVLLFVLVNRALRMIENANRLDSLTQLLRHQLFRERLDPIVKASDKNSQVALIYLDIDHFSEINNQIGIDKADQLLQQFAGALLENSRGSALIARISTDQFAIAIPKVINAHDAQTRAQTLRTLLQSVALAFEIQASCSIGIAIAPMDGITSKSLMAAASNALNMTKRTNRAGTLFYNHELSKREYERQKLLHDLREAIENEQLSLFYQPQFDTSTLDLCGVEVLVRWQHPEQGFISPDIFIPLAEENALISAISSFVIKKSFLELQRLLGKQIHRVSINISAVEFNCPKLIREIFNHISNVPSYLPYLQLEITETAAISNMEASIHHVEKLREQGIKVSLDDYGTGFSSLSILKNLPIDEVKIDRSFVFDLEQQPKSQSIVTALVSIANDFHIKVIAEGVETEAQRKLLHQLGCHEIQGYLLSAPIPVSCLVQSIERTVQVHPQLLP